MTHASRFMSAAKIAGLFLLCALPLSASAQSLTNDHYGWGAYWGRNSQLQQDIAALGSTPVTALPVPLLGIALSSLSPNFGDPRDGGARTHEGEDIMAPKGTPIVAPTAGVVLRTVTGASEGNAVYMAAPGGYTYVFMHLDRFGEGVAAGTKLAPGSLIGYVGNTGNAAGGATHLHFEVHDASNTPLDPMRFLTTVFSAADQQAFLTTILASAAEPAALAPFIVPAVASADTLPASTGTLALARNLKKGMTGADVKQLQQYLNAHGFTVSVSDAGSAGQETTYFGPATEAAVARYQAAHAIAPAVGYVGPITRAALSTIA